VLFVKDLLGGFTPTFFPQAFYDVGVKRLLGKHKLPFVSPHTLILKQCLAFEGNGRAVSAFYLALN